MDLINKKTTIAVLKTVLVLACLLAYFSFQRVDAGAALPPFECFVRCQHDGYVWTEGPYPKEKAEIVLDDHFREYPDHEPWTDCGGW